jgi:hypothetical protein
MIIFLVQNRRSSTLKTDRDGITKKVEIDADPDQAHMGSTKPKRN